MGDIPASVAIGFEGDCIDLIRFQLGESGLKEVSLCGHGIDSVEGGWVPMMGVLHIKEGPDFTNQACDLDRYSAADYRFRVEEETEKTIESWGCVVGRT